MEPPARPHVHFTPPSGWMNDPNGLVYADGVYHLCYQHHPDDVNWGPMHWGHATSTDLFAWEHHPIALQPDHLGTAFSGSAIVDRDAVAGFGPDALVAFFTHFEEGVPQAQGVAASTDGGATWWPYEGNPVVRAPEGLVDFRDPKVFRYADGGGDRHWVMVVAAGDEVAFFRSQDLLTWEPSSTFGRGHGAHEGTWETPDVFELEVAGTGERRWVLVVSVLAGAPAGGSGTQYFVGSFDGSTFTPDDRSERPSWVDHGGDFYAPQSWSDAPEGRRVWLAWMSNWAYGRTVPASTWRGVMTVPRELSLRASEAGPVLVQRPVAELEARGRELVRRFDATVEGTWPIGRGLAAADVELRFAVPTEATQLGVDLHGGAVRVTYLPGLGVLRVVRGTRGLLGADPGPREVPLPPRAGEVALRVVVDTCSVEVFADDGAIAFTDLVFPEPRSGATAEQTVALFAHGGPALVTSLVLRDLTGSGAAPGTPTVPASRTTRPRSRPPGS